MTAAQTQEIGDKIANYTQNIKEKAKGNLTEMNRLLLDDMVKRNIINEKDKQDLMSFNSVLNEFKPGSNLTLINREVSSRLEALANNSSNPIVVALKNNMKPDPCPEGIIVGGACVHLIAGNTTGIPNNITGANTGLPPMTIGIDEATWAATGKVLTCALVGIRAAIAYGYAGSLIAMQTCTQNM